MTYKSIPYIQPLPSPFCSVSVGHSWNPYRHHSKTPVHSFAARSGNEETSYYTHSTPSICINPRKYAKLHIIQIAGQHERCNITRLCACTHKCACLSPCKHESHVRAKELGIRSAHRGHILFHHNHGKCGHLVICSQTKAHIKHLKYVYIIKKMNETRLK